jgi:S-adenosylmethionine:tRNA ribosyltransferase-isomerase
MSAAVHPLRADPAAESWRARALAPPLAFELPDALSAHEPPEARGLSRDAVRLMVSRIDDDTITHTRFRNLPDFLDPRDVLVVNASATINAALGAWRVRPGGEFADRIALHLSTPLPPEGPRAADGRERWVVELRRLTRDGTAPLLDARPGERIALTAGASATLVGPFTSETGHDVAPGRVRLWIAGLACRGGVLAFAAEYGAPIRYSYVYDRWPLSYYQTAFAAEPGSAEMPSAGRPFTREILARLERKGVRVAPLVLHTGVASLESNEPPYPERYRVPPSTAAAVNAARERGGRVVAVGTTVVRALETVAAPDGRVGPRAGWTDLVITPERGVYAVDALLTGFHEPEASHLKLLEAFAGRDAIAESYRQAVRASYRWHEFGDVHLIVRG